MDTVTRPWPAHGPPHGPMRGHPLRFAAENSANTADSYSAALLATAGPKDRRIVGSDGGGQH